MIVADVAQLVEHRFVVPVVAGSSPVIRPITITSYLLRFYGYKSDVEERSRGSTILQQEELEALAPDRAKSQKALSQPRHSPHFFAFEQKIVAKVTASN